MKCDRSCAVCILYALVMSENAVAISGSTKKTQPGVGPDWGEKPHPITTHRSMLIDQCEATGVQEAQQIGCTEELAY